MPKRFTPQQLAASASVGALRTETSFEDDTDAWHTYQQTVFPMLMLGEAKKNDVSVCGRAGLDV